MKITLERAHVPEDIGRDEECGICGERFRTEVVLTPAVSEDRQDLGHVCPNCVEAMGAYRPDLFPTLAEYEEAKARWSGPIWSGIEEEEAAWESGEPWRASLKANTIARV